MICTNIINKLFFLKFLLVETQKLKAVVTDSDINKIKHGKQVCNRGLRQKHGSLRVP